jgi:hypothetical protein
VLTRRILITSLTGILCAPAIIRVAKIMPVKVERPLERLVGLDISRNNRTAFLIRGRIEIGHIYAERGEFIPSDLWRLFPALGNTGPDGGARQAIIR